MFKGWKENPQCSRMIQEVRMEKLPPYLHRFQLLHCELSEQEIETVKDSI